MYLKGQNENHVETYRFVPYFKIYINTVTCKFLRTFAINKSDFVVPFHVILQQMEMKVNEARELHENPVFYAEASCSDRMDSCAFSLSVQEAREKISYSNKTFHDSCHSSAGCSQSRCAEASFAKARATWQLARFKNVTLKKRNTASLL